MLLIILGLVLIDDPRALHAVYRFPTKLENVEHCGGKPEQADTGILCHR